MDKKGVDYQWIVIFIVILLVIMAYVLVKAVPAMTKQGLSSWFQN